MGQGGDPRCGGRGSDDPCLQRTKPMASTRTSARQDDRAGRCRSRRAADGVRRGVANSSSRRRRFLAIRGGVLRPKQLGLFPKNGAREGCADQTYERLGLEMPQMERWHNSGLLSWDPMRVTSPARWMLQEACFIRDLTRVEWSVNALRQILASLPRPYAHSHSAIHFDFKARQWKRTFAPRQVIDAALAEPTEAMAVIIMVVRSSRICRSHPRAEALQVVAG